MGNKPRQIEGLRVSLWLIDQVVDFCRGQRVIIPVRDLELLPSMQVTRIRLGDASDAETEEDGAEGADTRRDMQSMD